MNELRWKLLFIVAVTAVFSFLAWTQDINLGLDLRGGSHFVMRVDVDEAVAAEVRDDLDAFRRVLEDEDVEVLDAGSTGVETATLTVAEADVDRVVDMASEYNYTANYDIRRLGGGVVEMDLNAQARESVEDGTIRQALQTIRNRVDEYGVTEPVIQRQGLSGDRLLIQLPGVADPERIKSLLQSTALLELKLVQAGPAQTREALLEPYGGEVPVGMEVVPGDPESGTVGFYLLNVDAAVTGRDLKTARLGQDEMGLPSVNFTLNADAARKFGDFTGSNVGRYLAIVLDNEVKTAPVIEERIPGNGQIRGNYTLEEAEDLALVLRAGALPASMEYLEERSVGPALGRESIDRGVAAALIGLALVVAFMLVYYKGAGINAVIALALNLIVVLGVMAALGATLTLPGIAGLILLIGMAVDANVIIFERIREELDLGKTVRASIDAGFGKAFSAIVDANVTTLVAAVFLFQFGTGPVKGFAVTLSIGILASMFTAIFVSRVLFDLWTQLRPRTLSI